MEQVASNAFIRATRHVTGDGPRRGETATDLGAHCESCGASNMIRAHVHPGAAIELQCNACGACPAHLKSSKCGAGIDLAAFQPVIAGLRPLLWVIVLLGLVCAIFLAVIIGFGWSR